MFARHGNELFVGSNDFGFRHYAAKRKTDCRDKPAIIVLFNTYFMFGSQPKIESVPNFIGEFVNRFLQAVFRKLPINEPGKTPILFYRSGITPHLLSHRPKHFFSFGSEISFCCCHLPISKRGSSSSGATIVDEIRGNFNFFHLRDPYEAVCCPRDQVHPADRNTNPIHTVARLDVATTRTIVTDIPQLPITSRIVVFPVTNW